MRDILSCFNFRTNFDSVFLAGVQKFLHLCLKADSERDQHGYWNVLCSPCKKVLITKFPECPDYNILVKATFLGIRSESHLNKTIGINVSLYHIDSAQ